MALKTINIDYYYKPPMDGCYECIIEMFDIAALHINIYDDSGLLQTMTDVRNHMFYFTYESRVSFRGSIIIEENSKYKFSINRVGDRNILDGCEHNWVEYVGFTDRFTYCSKCDKKDKQ